jgi:hypothetical protein
VFLMVIPLKAALATTSAFLAAMVSLPAAAEAAWGSTVAP